MYKKTLQLSVCLASLAFVGAMNAQTFMNGSMSLIEFGNGSTWDSTSITLDSVYLITTSTLDIATSVPIRSDLTTFPTTVSGISSTPTAENIPNFFVFSSPDSTKNTSGTTPVNRFDFTLTSIKSTGTGAFVGTGTIIDTALSGGFANTAGTFTLSFTGAPDATDLGNSSFSFAALGVAPVPEPTTISLFATGLLGAWVMHRRKKAAR